MRLELKKAWIDMGHNLRLIIEAGTLVIDDAVGPLNGFTHDEAAIAMPKRQAAQPLMVRKSRGKRSKQQRRAGFYGDLENDVLVKLTTEKSPETFYSVGMLFKMVRPDKPPRDGVKPSTEYNRLRQAVLNLREDGYLEAKPISGRKMAFRLAPTLPDANTAQSDILEDAMS